MKSKLYHLLVNNHPGIKQRYHRFHDNAHGIKKIISWIYLLWLNFGYYILQLRFLGKTKESAIYEEKKLECRRSETEAAQEEGVHVRNFVKRLSEYDVISFDIFDTLLFRPFSEPTDLFYFIGEKLGRMNFKELRKEAENSAREQCYRVNGHYEVTLKEIWEQIEKESGLLLEQGMQTEIELEKKFCYANPFMLEVYRELQKVGKKIIIVSDMYLPEKVLGEILEANGYNGFEKIYVSCEYRANKATGKLFELVRGEYTGKIIHVGDNRHSDVTMAEKYSLATCHYPNVNEYSKKYRPYDMSPMIGGAYRGIVNNYLYQRTNTYSMEYEYGFIYGGLFVTGYCAFIHEYCKKNQVDKALFLSRDGDILKQAYDILFPDEKTEYVYWSRRAATKLMAAEDRYDFFRRFLFHKVNQKISLEEIMESMELSVLLTELPESLSKDALLTDKNVNEVKAFLEERWPRILSLYETEQNAARAYYEEVLQGCRKAVAVDIGWAGSGAVALNHLVQKVWKMHCEVIGLIAGTNTIHNAEPDASETFLQSGKLVSYLFSQSHNRDLMKKHDPNRNYNVYWELLLSSPTPQFRGFALDEKNGWKLVFGKCDANSEGIKEVQKGILAFVLEYKEHFGDIPYMFHISGRDAYAPMLVATSENEKYLIQMEKRFALEIHVG